jgi:hypothetical protein
VFSAQTLLGRASCREAGRWGGHGTWTSGGWHWWQRRLWLLLLGVALLLCRLLLLLRGELLLIVLEVGVLHGMVRKAQQTDT